MSKSREEIEAERKLRKAAKQAKKKGNLSQDNCTESPITDTIIQANSLRNDMRNLKVDEIKKSQKCSTVQSSSMESCKNDRVDINNDMFSGEVIKEDVEVHKSKSQLRAERRLLQESQRASKDKKKIEELKKKKIPQPNPVATAESKSLVAICDNSKISKVIKVNNVNQVKLVSHLYTNEQTSFEISKKSRFDIHKSVIKLSAQYRDKLIIGSNARVVAFLNTLKQVLADFDCEHSFSREFETVIEDTIQYIKMYRAPAVSMTNAVKYLKLQLLQFEDNIANTDAQMKLKGIIDEYIYLQINKAGEAICISIQKKISENDVILTFGYSSLIERILVESHKRNLKFRVIIVDSAPLYEGKELLRRLVRKGLNCDYVLLSAASYIMNEATKVLLGAHALLTNGYVMARSGSSQIALIAKTHNVPVLVCCETHKFSDQVQTDALVHNELGESLKQNSLKSNNNFKSLTLMYDVTPSDLVTAVVTELAILPCTSVPVVLRVKPASLI